MLLVGAQASVQTAMYYVGHLAPVPHPRLLLSIQKMIHQDQAGLAVKSRNPGSPNFPQETWAQVAWITAVFFLNWIISASRTWPGIHSCNQTLWRLSWGALCKNGCHWNGPDSIKSSIRIWTGIHGLSCVSKLDQQDSFMFISTSITMHLYCRFMSSVSCMCCCLLQSVYPDI